MADLNFLLTKGTPPFANSATLVRAKATEKDINRMAEVPNMLNMEKYSHNMCSSVLQDISFNNTTNILKQGEGLLLFFGFDISTIVDFKLRVKNLGVNTALSFGLGTIDKSQLQTLKTAVAKKTNDNMETLPIFTSYMSDLAVPVTSLKTDTTFFMDSFATATDTFKDIKDAKNTLYGFDMENNGIFDNQDQETSTHLFLFNSGTADIIAGSIMSNVLFIKK